MASQGDDPPARVRGKESTLEIFLFTNGQQDSPPRKYSVHVGDRWDTTLNFMARTQNGSQHNIELYTTEGKKIEKGVELIRGEAYVAVEPPKGFIAAGYRDYLLKASRSREKRQEKNTIGSDLSIMGKDNTSPKTKTEEGNKDTTNIQIIQDITIRPTNGSAIEEQDALTNNVKSDLVKAVKPIKRMSLKPTQKRNSSHTQQNSNIVRKHINNVTPPIKRASNLSKIDVAKKKVEISSNQNNRPSIATTKDEIIVMKAHESIPKDIDASVARMISHTQMTQTVIETYEPVNPTDTVHGPGANSNYKSPQNLIRDPSVADTNELFTENQEKARESAFIMPVKIRSLTDVFSAKRDTAVSIFDQDTRNIPNTRNISPLNGSQFTGLPKGVNRNESKTTATVPPNVPNASQKKTFLFGSQTGDNNFTIYVKHGDVIKLKLNIDVKNVSSTTFEPIYDNYTKPVASVENVAIKKYDTRKDPPASKTFRDTPTLTEPSPSVAGVGLPHEDVQQKANELFQCKYSSCIRNPENLAPVYVDNNNYFILLPPEETKGNFVSCSCKLQINEESKGETPDIQALPRNGNKDAGEGKHESNVSECSEHRKSLVAVTPKENLLLPERCSIAVIEGALCDCCVQDQMRRPCDCPNRPSTTSLCSAEDVARLPAMANCCRARKDAYTQTDWNGIVLEARPLESGGYAFHIPSLKLLKTANSLYQ